MERIDCHTYRMLEFFVQDVVSKGGRVVVVGTVDNRKVLRVGDSFSKLRTAPALAPVAVELTVSAIDHYRVLVDELPIGHAGGISLVGKGLELIRAGMSLFIADETES